MFSYICSLVHNDLESNEVPGLANVPGRIIPVEKQVGIALRQLATGDGYLSLGESFGVGESTACQITHRFVASCLLKAGHHVSWPTPQEMQLVKQGFQDKQGLVNCCGAIDATHFKMELSSTENAWEYRGRYKEFTMVMQAIAGPNKRFLDIVTGWPGAANDTRILYNSSFYQLANEGNRLQGPSVMIEGQPLREYIIGDAGYPLLPWLIIPFPGRGLVPKMDSFNYKHSSTRTVVEGAFGFLKQVWRILGRKVWRGNVKYFMNITYACAILHNIRIERADEFDPAMLQPLDNGPVCPPLLQACQQILEVQKATETVLC